MQAPDKSSRMAAIKRASHTESRIRSKDIYEIVEWIHRLEDAVIEPDRLKAVNAELVETNERLLHVLTVIAGGELGAKIDRAVNAELVTVIFKIEAVNAELVEVAIKAEKMLRTHANWIDGVYIRNPERGADEDLVIVHLPGKVTIIDLADEISDVLAKAKKGAA